MRGGWLDDRDDDAEIVVAEYDSSRIMKNRRRKQAIAWLIAGPVGLAAVEMKNQWEKHTAKLTEAQQKELDKFIETLSAQKENPTLPDEELNNIKK